MERISIRKSLSEPPKDIDGMISWISEQLCLSSGRDINNLATKILKVLLEHASSGKALTSKEISVLLNTTHSAVNHHIRNLIEIGILLRKKNKIYLRRRTLRGIIGELRKDLDRILNDIEEVAELIDKKLGLDSEGW